MTKSSPPKADPTELRIEPDKAVSKIQARIDEGESLKSREIRTEEEFENLKADYYSWDEFNVHLLKRIFTTEEISEEYSYWGGGIVGGHRSLSGQVQDRKKDISDKIRRLKSVVSRLHLFDGPSNETNGSVPIPVRRESRQTNKIFLVHGRDERMRDAVARFLHAQSLSPVILSEKPNEGRTIIEKFEQEADVGFAVVCLSGDDLGKLSTESDWKPRARQNVILELGYFVGRLERRRVCALLKGDLELPSDVVGVGFVQFDENEGWKLKLGRELKAAGYNVDLLA